MVRNAKAETALERVARLRSELIEAETSLDRMVAEERARAVREEIEDVRPVEAEPEVMLTVVKHVIHGPGALVFDEGALVDPPTDVPNAARNATVRSWLGGLVHPAAVKKQGRVCGGCGVTYQTEPKAREHWGRQHSARAVERLEDRRRRDESDKLAQATPTVRGEDGAALAARLTGEWERARYEALHPRPLDPGTPIPRPETRDDSGPEAA